MGSDPGHPNGDATISDAQERWKAATTALERVQQVIEQTTTAKPASEIADKALVSDPTARKHLKALVEIGTATAIEEPEATMYVRNEDTVLYQRIQALATEYSRDALIEQIHEMKRRITEFEDVYNAVSPEELTTTLGADAPVGAWEAVAEWQTTERNLHIAQAAINYGRARDLGAATQ